MPWRCFQSREVQHQRSDVQVIQPTVEKRISTPETVLNAHLANGLNARMHLQRPLDEQFTNSWNTEDFANLFETVEGQMQDAIRQQRRPDIFTTGTFSDHNNRQHHVSMSTSADDHQNMNQGFNDVSLGMDRLVQAAEHDNTGLIGTTQWVIDFLRNGVTVYSLIFFLLN